MRSLILVTAALLAGCVNVQAVRLGDGIIRPPVSPDRVAIYRTADQVKREYEEVALLTASGDYQMTNMEMMYTEMRKRAGALGANGIVLDAISEPATGAKVANFFLGTPAERQGKAVAIYVMPRDGEPEPSTLPPLNPAPPRETRVPSDVASSPDRR